MQHGTPLEAETVEEARDVELGVDLRVDLREEHPRV